MRWRDFFYFSKGERRALIVLLSLISIAWITLVLTNKYTRPTKGESVLTGVLYPVCIYPLDTGIRTSAETSVDLTAPPQKDLPEKETSPPAGHPSSYRKPVRIEKYPEGTLVELNTADTLILKKVPGIRSAFSNRIVKYRNLLGGFYSVSQLSEVYGIDEDRYLELKEWFCVNPQLTRKIQVNHLPLDSLPRHPYINYRQAKAINRLYKQKGKLTGWENLVLLEEFNEFDRQRIEPYLSFE